MCVARLTEYLRGSMPLALKLANEIFWLPHKEVVCIYLRVFIRNIYRGFRCLNYFILYLCKRYENIYFVSLLPLNSNNVYINSKRLYSSVT